MIEILYQDRDVIVCVKPCGVRSTDEPGGLPELIRQTLGDANANIRTVHRLDQVVSGLMVLARSKKAAAELSRQVREGGFGKYYRAVVHGELPQKGIWRDLLLRNKEERKTYVVGAAGPDVQEAVLDFVCLGISRDMSQASITLHTGRTHQIRCQFSSHGFPLVGDRKYSTRGDGCPIALWSEKLEFSHPYTGAPMTFFKEPPEIYPWNQFPAGKCD